MTITTIRACIDGIGLLGPGLNGWPGSLPILSGQQPYQPQKTVLPAPALLPPAERRRSGDIQSGRNGFFEVIETEVRTNRVGYTLTPERGP